MPSIDIDKLLEQLLSDPRLREGKAFVSVKTYDSEPIIRRGSQMDSYRPPEIAKLRSMQRTPAGRTWSEARLFFEQARIMEDYEDHADFTTHFLQYYPTYRSMTDEQLRGYFSWRTKVRAGDVEKSSTSYAYVYLYELLMGIGCTPGEDGFHKIEAFWKAYREFDPGLDRNVCPWLVDYVVDHALDPALAAPYAGAEHDNAIAALEKAERDAVVTAPPKGIRRSPLEFGPAVSEQARALVGAIEELSTYRPSASKYAREEPKDFAQVMRAVFVRLARHYDRTHNLGLTETLFGTRFALNHLMYAAAVHYEPAPHPDCTYGLSPTRRYTCTGGSWVCYGFHDGGSRSAKLGQIVRAVDRQLRAAVAYPHPLKEHAEPKYLVKMIDAEVSDYLAWKEAHTPRHVDIDLSKLGAIRSAAATTREALLVDEEREEAPTGLEVESGAQPPAKKRFSPSSNSPVRTEAPLAPPAHAELRAARSASSQAETLPYGLTEEELALLRALLAGNASQVKGSIDLLVDSINEKLFDLLGDTALEFGPDGSPRIIEDYIEDVRGIC